MSRESDKALLEAFAEWYKAQPEYYYEPRLDVARFLAARAPAPPDPTPLAVALRLVADLCAALPLDTLPADACRDINALHGAIRDVEIGLRLDEVAPCSDCTPGRDGDCPTCERYVIDESENRCATCERKLPAPCPECRDLPHYLDIGGGEVPCQTCGRTYAAPAPGPLPSCPVCGAVRGDWECRHGAKDEPAPSLDRCLSCSVGVLDSRLGGMCGDHPGDCPAPSNRQAAIAASPWFREAYEGQSLGETMPIEGAAPPPAPEGERFWRVCESPADSVPGHGWGMEQCYADGTCATEGTLCLRATRAEAEADGRASGLREWKPAPEGERFWRVYEVHEEDGYGPNGFVTFVVFRQSGQCCTWKPINNKGSRKTRAEAEADGRASGRKEWKP